MTTESAGHRGTARDAPDGGDDPAAALRAAVRAVESGEASAAEFFTRPAAPPPAAPPAPPPGAGAALAGAAAGGGNARPAAVPAELTELLATGDMPATLGPALTAVLGEGAAAALRADPWTLLRAPGVRPEQADAFARTLVDAGACAPPDSGDGGPDDPRRGISLVVRALESAALRGDTAREIDALCRELAGQAVAEPRGAVEDAAEAGAVLLVEEPVPGAVPDAEGQVPTRIVAALEQHAAAEEALADGLARLRGTFVGRTTESGGPDWVAAADRVVAPAAAELIRAVADHAVVLHTATAAARTEPDALLTAAGEEGLRAVRVTHTATSEQPDGSGAPGPVLAVADLLAGAPDIPRDAGGALALDLLVVLDAEQLTTETAASLTELLPDGARLVLSGDPALLGPPGAGRPFTELLATDLLPRVAARTPLPGPLGELVSGVADGELPQVEAPEREVVVVPVTEPGEALHRTVQLVTDSIPRAFGEHGRDLVALTATHGGPVGTRAVNAALKERLNPGPGRFGGFDPGDRVAWSPVPGRTVFGTVAGQTPDGAVRLDQDGPGDQLTVAPGHGSLRHGWAVTVHQAAGRTWPAAVVVVPGDAAGVLDRAWAYTAFSRARRHLSVVQGAGPALAGAVRHRPTPPTTRLATLLRQSTVDAAAE